MTISPCIQEHFLKEVEFERLGANSKMCNASFFLPYFIYPAAKQNSFCHVKERMAGELDTQFRSVTQPPAFLLQTLKEGSFNSV